MNNNEDKIINKDKIIIDGEGKILNASEATVIDRNKATVLKEKNFNGGRIVYYILGLLEVMLGFRLVFKLLGANPGSGFVSFISVSYTHLRAHETRHDLVCRLLLEKKKKKTTYNA